MTVSPRGMTCAGGSLSGTLKQQSSTQQELGADISPLQVSVQYLTSSIMRVKIGAPGRWEVPMSLFNSTVPTGVVTFFQLIQRLFCSH